MQSARPVVVNQIPGTRPLVMPEADAATEETKPVFVPKSVLMVLRIKDDAIPFNLDHPVTVGRKTHDTKSLFPIIDMGPFNGYELGVSRRHARISRSSEGYPEIVDIGSANGTFLNDKRMNAHRAYRLSSGDELRFGFARATIYFETGES